jgi:type I restriction enzyme S subunit
MSTKSSYTTVPLGTLAEFRNGVNYNKDNFGRGIKVINVKDFQDHTVTDFDGLDEINPHGIVREESLLKDDDIIFVRSNGNRELIGRSLYVRGVHEAVTHSAFTIIARFTSESALPRYYAYVVRTPLIRQALSAHGGGTNISNLNQSILSDLLVPFPPLSIQRKVVDILSAYDDLIENNTRRIKILQEMAQMLHREWFVHFRFPGHEHVRLVDSPLGPVPEAWEIGSFTEFVDIFSGGTPRTSTPEYWNGDIPWFTPRDLAGQFFVTDTERKITALGLSKCNSKLYPVGTVFITARGTVGNCVINSVPMAMSQTNYALRGKGLPQEFVYLMTLNLVDVLRQSATGAVFDTIVLDTFRMQMVIRPPTDLLSRFAAVVQPIFDLLLKLQQKNSNLLCTRDLLLPGMIAGNVEATDIPSTKLKL